MKKFLRDLAVFFGLFLLLFHIYPEYLFRTKKYFQTIGTEIFLAVEKSENTFRTRITKLYLGDSVDGQILSVKPLGKGELNLSTNQAISLVGQFILLHNLIENKNQIDTLELRIHPFGLSNNLDNSLTYNYFLKPFYKSKYLPLFSNQVKSRIEEIPFYYLSQYHPVLTSMWSPNYSSKNVSETISQINMDYLLKIHNLCKKNQIVFKLRAVPLNEARKTEIEQFTAYVKSNKLLIFNNYVQDFNYLPDANFIEDNIHLKRAFLTKDLY